MTKKQLIRGTTSAEFALGCHVRCAMWAQEFASHGSRSHARDWGRSSRRALVDYIAAKNRES